MHFTYAMELNIKTYVLQKLCFTFSLGCSVQMNYFLQVRKVTTMESHMGYKIP